MHFKMRLLATILATCSAFLWFNYPALAADSALLKGKVLSPDGIPVGGVKIVIYNEDTRAEISGHSDRRGDFEIEHLQCSTLSFDVLPPEKTGLTSAHYAHVSGEATTHFIVKLHRGFHVTGRVLAEGQGIKGLEIKAISMDSEGSPVVAHGGGLTRTRGNGEYFLLLTPGKKTIQIKNDMFSNLSPLYQHEFTITGDVRLPDMTLPLLKDK
jgi:hypothetical protein